MNLEPWLLGALLLATWWLVWHLGRRAGERAVPKPIVAIDPIAGLSREDIARIEGEGYVVIYVPNPRKSVRVSPPLRRATPDGGTTMENGGMSND